MPAPRSNLAVSITGIAGPGGGSPEKPVGLVHFGLARRGQAPRTERRVFPGDRAVVRGAALELASACSRRTQMVNMENPL